VAGRVRATAGLTETTVTPLTQVNYLIQFHDRDRDVPNTPLNGLTMRKHIVYQMGCGVEDLGEQGKAGGAANREDVALSRDRQKSCHKPGASYRLIRPAAPQSAAALLGACASRSSLGFGVHTMPIDLPPVRKPAQAVAALPPSLMGRSLNWLAFVVAIGLCAWSVSNGMPLLR
jgi:hypothetical protein